MRNSLMTTKDHSFQRRPTRTIIKMIREMNITCIRYQRIKGNQVVAVKLRRATSRKQRVLIKPQSFLKTCMFTHRDNSSKSPVLITTQHIRKKKQQRGIQLTRRSPI
jgi:hypothetical protein